MIVETDQRGGRGAAWRVWRGLGVVYACFAHLDAKRDITRTCTHTHTRKYTHTTHAHMLVSCTFIPRDIEKLA